MLFNRGFSRFSDDTPTFSCFLAFTQDHTDVMLCFLVLLPLHRTTQINRGFSRFSDDTPTFSCFPAFTQDHTDVLLFNRGFSRFSDDTPMFSCFPLHRTTQMYCYLIEDFPVTQDLFSYLYTGPHRCTVI